MCSLLIFLVNGYYDIKWHIWLECYTVNILWRETWVFVRGFSKATCLTLYLIVLDLQSIWLLHSSVPRQHYAYLSKNNLLQIHECQTMHMERLIIECSFLLGISRLHTGLLSVERRCSRKFYYWYLAVLVFLVFNDVQLYISPRTEPKSLTLFWVSSILFKIFDVCAPCMSCCCHVHLFQKRTKKIKKKILLFQWWLLW